MGRMDGEQAVFGRLGLWDFRESSSRAFALFRLLGAYGLCPGSRDWCVLAPSPSRVYAAGKFQWHFACGFDFGYGL